MIFKNKHLIPKLNLTKIYNKSRGFKKMFFSYVTLGFTIALPMGAISIEMIKQGLRNGFWYAWMIGIGAITIDITLILLLNLGLADILNEIQTYLWLLGTFFLSYLGWQSIKSDSLCINDSDSKKDSLFKLFKKGIIIGVNPANIVFWISVLGTSISSASTNSEVQHYFSVHCNNFRHIAA